MLIQSLTQIKICLMDLACFISRVNHYLQHMWKPVLSIINWPTVVLVILERGIMFYSLNSPMSFSSSIWDCDWWKEGENIREKDFMVRFLDICNRQFYFLQTKCQGYMSHLHFYYFTTIHNILPWNYSKIPDTSWKG